MEILGLVNIPLLCLLLLTLLGLLYVYGTWLYSLWTSQGVPGPRPWPFVGNLMEMMEESNFRVFTKWQQQHGRIFGCYYSCVRPCLVITDLDMIREIFVKHSNNFSERNIIRGMIPRTVDKALFFAHGATWKRIRYMMSPSFTTSKLKMMCHHMKHCSDLLVSSLQTKARSDQLIDVKEVFGSFTMDTIAGTAFGLETNSQTQEGEPFVQNCKVMFSNAGFPGLLRFAFYFANVFPFLGPLMGWAGFGRNAHFFFTAIGQMVDERREENKSQNQRPPDLLQMLVEAEADPESITDQAQNNGDTKIIPCLTKEEVIAQGFIVMAAGYETTATTLQYLTYCLALNPHIQQSVFQEIQDELGDAEPTYDNISQLKYMDATLHETLRMFPPLPLIDRLAVESMTVKGIHIPAGCVVNVPIYTILHDPEYFPDPDVFNPDRFLEENMASIHPVTVELAFGYGPRKCVGLRLAMLEMKFAAVKMFRRVRFVKCAETAEKVTVGKGMSIAIPDVVIKLKAELRSSCD